MAIIRYRIRYTYSARDDIAKIKKYILDQFKYHELIETFKEKIHNVERSLTTFPDGYEPSRFVYRGYTVFMRAVSSYLIFYVVDKQSSTVYILRVLHDGMNWDFIIDKWLREFR